MKENSPWLQVIRCFNHRLELAIKDAFINTVFLRIDEMLSELYKLYKYSSKREDLKSELPQQCLGCL